VTAMNERSGSGTSFQIFEVRHILCLASRGQRNGVTTTSNGTLDSEAEFNEPHLRSAAAEHRR
jgi:hypothetical protein